MTTIDRDADDAGRLTLASLLALGLHAVLLLGIPSDWWSIRYAQPLRFNVTLLPPVTRSNMPDLPTNAPEPPEPIAKPGVSTTLAVPEPTAPAPELMPAPLPLAPIPPPAVVAPVPPPTLPARPVGVTKPTPKPPPARKDTAAKPPTTSTPPAAVKPAASTKSTSLSPRKAPASAAKPVVRPREDAPLLAKPPAPVAPSRPREDAPLLAKPPAPGATEPTLSGATSGAVSATIRPTERPASRPRATGAGARRGRLDSSALLGQIASLETETQRRASAGVRGKRVNPNDTQSPEGFYIAAWVRKVEHIGEMNFPEVARRLELTTGPVLDVSIRADGSLQDVRIVRSSGNVELDRAAQRIVRLGAPYAAFPPRLRQQYDVLHISRPWRFDPGGRVRAR